MSGSDTIFALSSGRPPAAISVIRISGPQAHQAGTLIAGELPAARFAAVRELRHPLSSELLDEGLVLRFDAPATATGENVVELQCHGGRAVIDGVLAALASIEGLRGAEPGEFTRRAFANGRIDLTEAEGLADLLEAETESQRKAALVVAEGGLRRQIDEWQTQVLELSAEAERAIDYDEEDEALDPRIQAASAALASELGEWLARPRVERLKDGILVVVAGPPNAGKSSLINAIVGEDRVIVTDMPGTTRDHIEVAVALGGMPVRLTDTAGLRESEDPIEALGVARSEGLIQQADVLLWLGELKTAPPHPCLIAVSPKADLPRHTPVSPDAMAVSAHTGEGLAALLDRVRTLGEQVLPDEGAIALNRRQANLLELSAHALDRAARAPDIPIFAEELRQARSGLDRLTGRAGVEHVLNALFSRFCLGK